MVLCRVLIAPGGHPTGSATLVGGSDGIDPLSPDSRSVSRRSLHIALLLSTVAFLITGCGSAVEINDRTVEGGNPAVYERIETTSDCAVLQSEFDTAMANVDRYEDGDDRREVPLSYAEAANDRLRAFC